MAEFSALGFASGFTVSIGQQFSLERTMIPKLENIFSQGNSSRLFPLVLIPSLGLSPNLHGTRRAERGCPRGGGEGPRHGAMADVTSRKNEGCVSALINNNESATMGEIFG